MEFLLTEVNSYWIFAVVQRRADLKTLRDQIDQRATWKGGRYRSEALLVAPDHECKIGP